MSSQETVAVLPALFEEYGPRLRAVAYRMLGSFAEADEAVRETRRRLDRTGDGAAGVVGDPGRWLTVAVGRVSLDLLHARPPGREPPGAEAPADEEERALLTDTAALDTLTPAERLAFVLHDLFSVPIDEIAPLVGRTPAATRQLAARARRRTQGLDDLPEPDPEQQREVVSAFAAAARGGDAEAMAALLDEDAVLRTDETSTAHGARPVARAVAERAATGTPVLVDGVAGLVWPAEGPPRTVLAFTVLDGRITAVDVIADAPHLARVSLSPHGP
ncbi:sigma factor-like helix-turn-helix DNA-binding protein [Streptomyces sp. HUAS MG47]|uniref:sigma factor-like helix-turn-helix DNA-binding protein n=1 Tax=Streptomyces solicamelliae TaxID=3231716 RepID=UPI003877E6F9